MSRNSVMKDLSLDNYFWAILGSSQEDDKSQGPSPSRKSFEEDDSIEKTRKEVLPLSNSFSDERPFYSFPNKNKADYLTPIDKVQFKPKATPTTIGGSTRENTIQKISMSIPSTRKATPVNALHTEIDQELKFNTSAEKMASDMSISTNSGAKSSSSRKKRIQMPKTGSQDVPDLRGLKREDSLDESDCELIDQMLEEDAKKNSSQANSFGNHSQKFQTQSNLTHSQEDMLLLETADKLLEEANKQKNMHEEQEMPRLVSARTMQPIAIDEARLRKAALLFEEDENGDLKNPSQVLSQKNRIVVANPNSLNKAGEIFSQNYQGSSQKNNLKSSPICSQSSIYSQGPKITTPKPETIKRIMKLFGDDYEDDFLTMKLNAASQADGLKEKEDHEPLERNSTNLPSKNQADEYPIIMTGSQKPIKVNPARLKQAAKLFEDEDDDGKMQLEETSTMAKQVLLGFQKQPFKPASISTANNDFGFKIASSNNKLTINPKNLEKAKKLFDDDEEEESHLSQPTEPRVFKNAASPGKMPSFGFQTAGNNKLYIDPKKLEKVKEMFEDDDYVPSQTIKTSNGSRPNSQQPNKLTVSPQSLQKVKKILEDDEEDTTAMPSFKTAGQNKLHIDPKKLEQAKKLFEEDENGSLPSSQRMLETKLKVQNPASLNHSQQLLSNDKPTISHVSPAKVKPQPQMISFGVKQMPSKAAYERAMKLFADDEDLFPQGQGKTEEPLLFTAGGKKLHVSEANMQKAASLFTDNEDENPSKVTIKPAATKPNVEMPMLQKASGKEITIKPENLQRVMNMFKDDDEPEPTPKIQETPSFNKIQAVPQNFSVKQMKSFSNPVSNENSHSIPYLGAKSEQSRDNSNRLDSIIEEEKAPKDKEEDDNQEIKQVLKKKFIPELRPKTSPTTIILQDKTNNLHGKFSVRPLEAENKKIKTFKFTENAVPAMTNSTNSKDNNDNNQKKDGKISKEDPTKQESKTKLKRNFDNFIDNSIGQTGNGMLISLEENPKIKHFLTKLKFNKLTQSENSYFFPENYMRKPRGIPLIIADLTISNTINHKFECPCVDCLQTQGDAEFNNFACFCDGNLVIGWPEFRKAMLAQGLKPEYVSEAWVKNHYRLIIWKLASIERRLKKFQSSKKLNFVNVKAELEYRYYIEHIQGKRSVLQKVLQKDEFSANHMVLLVGEISKQNTHYLVELSDGWYSVYFEVKIEATFKQDKNLMTNNQLLYYLIRTNRLYSGLKVHLAGMRIIKKEGKPEEEQAPDAKVLVEISYNAISRAKWDEKLGVAKSKSFRRTLTSLRNHGGFIPMIDVFVVKKYKLLEKTNNGTKLFEEVEEGESALNKKVFFRIKVADAVIYHDQNNLEKYNDILCEIEITNFVFEMYNELKEGDRVRFYNLKGFPKYDRNFKLFDHAAGKAITHYLFLQLMKNTTFQNLSSIKSLKEENLKYKEFAKASLLTPCVLSSVEFHEPAILSFYQKEIRLCKNEIDIVGVILESDHQKAFGYLSNGNIFKLLIHSKPFFSNFKLLEKKDQVIIIRNAQVDSVERVPIDLAFCFNLRTTENTYFTQATNMFKDEATALTKIIADKNKKQIFSQRLDKLLKRYKYPSSESIDDETLEKMLLEEEQLNPKNPEGSN